MSPRRIDSEDPDRLYTVTGGRTAAGREFDLVALVVSEHGPEPGMQSEHAKILRLAAAPVSVVELSADLRLPVTAVMILLSDLLDAGHITIRHPLRTDPTEQKPTPALLKELLHGLQRL